MYKYAILDASDVVIGISLLSGPIESANHISIDWDAEITTADVYNRANNEFSRPDRVIQPSLRISEADLGRKITVNAFRSRFSWAESVAFENALTTSAELRVLDKRLAAVVATHVDLDDLTYANIAMPAMVAAGIHSAARADEILSAPTQWKELPPAIQQNFIAAGYQIDV